MKLTLRLFLILMIGAASFTAHARQPGTRMNTMTLGQSLGEMLFYYYQCDTLSLVNSREQVIDQFRHLPNYNGLFPGLGREVIERRFHSLPLINVEKVERQGLETVRGRFTTANVRAMLRAYDNTISSAVLRLNQVDRNIAIMVPFLNWWDSHGESELWPYNQSDNRNVMGLIEFANSIYVDPLTALGVVGEALHWIRTAEESRFPQLAPLANLGTKLRPLLTTASLNGTAYHHEFISYLNRRIYTRGWLLLGTASGQGRDAGPQLESQRLGREAGDRAFREVADRFNNQIVPGLGTDRSGRPISTCSQKWMVDFEESAPPGLFMQGGGA